MFAGGSFTIISVAQCNYLETHMLTERHKFSAVHLFAHLHYKEKHIYCIFIILLKITVQKNYHAARARKLL